MKHRLKHTPFGVSISVIALVVFWGAASNVNADVNADRTALFKQFVNGEVPIKEAVVYREMSSTNGTVLNREWWRFGYQKDTWFVQCLTPNPTNQAQLIPKNSGVYGQSFNQFWFVTDNSLITAAKEVAAGSWVATSSRFERSLIFEALSLGVPRNYSTLYLTNATVKWEDMKFETSVVSKRDHQGNALITSTLVGQLNIGTNGFVHSVEYPSIGDFMGDCIIFEYAADSLGIPDSYTEHTPQHIFRYQLLSLVLGKNALAMPNGYEPAAFVDMKLNRNVCFCTNELSYSQRDGKSYPMFRPPEPKLGEPPPKLQAAQWLNTTNALSLDDLRGKVVLLDFWTVNCPQCIEDTPKLEALHNKFKDQGLVVIGVSYNEKRVARILKERGTTYPTMLDKDLQIADLKTGYTTENYVLDASPSYALIDRAGNLVWKSTLSSFPEESQIKSLLGLVPSK